MPSSSLADYLAKNYLTADPPAPADRPKKKRKKTSKTEEASGLIIADDDPPDLRAAAATGARMMDDDEYNPIVVAGRGGGGGGGGGGQFRRAKKSGWKTVGSGAGQDAESDAADAILALAAAERRAGRGGDEMDEDDEPVVAEEGDFDGGLRMESGAKAGLQTAADTAAMVAAQERKKKLEAARFKDSRAGEGEKAQETIYRDASGRIINVALKRAEARRAEEEKKLKEEEAREALMGDVQRREREERRQQLQEAKAMPLARRADDDELNDELKARQRWNDPAAQFLTKSTGPGTSVTGKPLYKGAFQPNRYGIRPGHRWDGVDRSNGFEKEWFAARNRKGRLEALDYQWQMDE
ncbi:putative cell cycle control protein (Cwf26) [Aspergillus saccharolyticus JOP 1030-1]|uniref:Cell cycle control protein n=1 Tax=Aspergillus saccharolyticus JOP 1030-1 TaxID=1450539 RepID=A0A318ZST9_9EURO|nr:hypothetical protein BP01DRAFT_286395 [Aspergillus saccharolyticus JOP 1030-1]PYH49765.1 hypothetical protein BP01DRAFT_286395 [Aspergillus saccharolyticus JOP 1030-1]